MPFGAKMSRNLEQNDNLQLCRCHHVVTDHTLHKQLQTILGHQIKYLFHANVAKHKNL